MSSHSYHRFAPHAPFTWPAQPTPLSSSRRVLAQVLARKERDAQQMHQLLKLTFAKLDEESQRATDAERRATECLVRARTAIDARAQSDADATAARAELALYKVQLEQAQREISRAQDYLDGLEARRHDAEQDAARARSVARKLQEERAIDVAREEGKQQGWHEGLRQGMLLGRREAENELRSSSRPRRHGLGDAHFTPVTPEPLQHGTSERSSPDDLPSRGLPRPRASSRRTPEIVPVSPAPSVPIRAAPFRRSPEQPSFSSAAARPHNRALDGQPYDSPFEYVSETSPSISPPPSRSRSRPRPETPALEPARSRPYTPHDDSTPSIIQPIPIPASGSSIGPLPLHSPSPSPRHPSVRIPPDNWIPHAQNTAGDGGLSIYLPPPHELIEPVRVPEGPYAIAATPEDGSPAVVPPPPIFPSSPGPSTRRSHDHTYTYATHSPPDLGSAVRAPKGSRSREYLYAGTPPPPDLSPAARPRDYATAPLPPPPDLAPTSDERPFLPPQGITQIASINSRASTHLSEFDLLAPVDQPRNLSNIGPPPAEEDELEYVDAQTESIPRRPIAPDPPPQRRRAHAKKPPSRGPPRPRNIVLPAPLGRPRAQPAVPSHPQYVPPPPVNQQPYGVYMPPRRPQDEDDAPLQAAATSTRPQRSHTQSSIGISVEPPSPDDSPPSSGNKSQRRPDLLSPEHAERPLPMSIMENFIPRNKPQPAPPQEESPLAPLPELAGISPDFAPLPGALPANIDDSRYPARLHSANRYMYEAAPVPAGIEYPASPLQAAAYGVPGKMRPGESDAPLSPLSIPSGFLGLKNRLPWRRNTAK
ncbi:hypothetical protein BC826DRAFT_967873 [Russula brevipes]|nr:hypothetical protein BC826DRAFT_967873 [Russula brevipes]